MDFWLSIFDMGLEGSEFNIDPSLWYIIDITLDEKKYPSFYSMKLNGDLNEAL